MATVPKSFIRAEVLAYLKAGRRLLRRLAGSHDQFMIASQILQQKESPYTEKELVLVQDMVLRISVKLGR